MSKKHVPQARQAERALICAVLLVNKIIVTANVDQSDFMDGPNQLMWCVMADLWEAGHPLDEITIEDELERRGKLDFINGIGGLQYYLMAGGSSGKADDYAETIRERARARRILKGAADIQDAAWNGEAAAGLEDRIHALSKASADTVSSCITVPQLIKERFIELDATAAARERGEFLNGIPTGIAALDEECSGVQFGLATIVGARPGMGKSSFAMEVATHAAQLDGYDVHVFSLEDTKQMFADRLLAKLSGVPASVIRRAELSDVDMDKLTRAHAKLSKLNNFRYQDVSGVSAAELVRYVERERRPGRKLLVVVDYIQILRWPKYARDENMALTQTIGILADAARANLDAYLVLSQLSRECETRANKRPIVKDLRASGELEQRSKAIWFLYRGSEYGGPVDGVDYHGAANEPPPGEWKNTVEILVRKNSNGEPRFDVKCHWDGPTMRIRQRERCAVRAE